MRDFGPVPVSRLKEEASAVFDALQAGSRVLVSRHGQVVAAIEPPSLVAHGAELAAYAVGGSSIAELSATDIAQRSPSEAVRRAEAGTGSLVTRGNKVYGVLTGPPSPKSLREIDAEERALVAFEGAYPDASAEEFAAASESATVALTDSVGSIDRLRDEVLVDAMLVKGLALEEQQDTAAAERAFRTAIDRFGHHPNPRVRSRAARAMVELAKMYVVAGQPGEAVELADEAVGLLGPA